MPLFDPLTDASPLLPSCKTTAGLFVYFGGYFMSATAIEDNRGLGEFIYVVREGRRCSDTWLHFWIFKYLLDYRVSAIPN
jgi:hypothetical protein